MHHNNCADETTVIWKMGLIASDLLKSLDKSCGSEIVCKHYHGDNTHHSCAELFHQPAGAEIFGDPSQSSSQSSSPASNIDSED